MITSPEKRSGKSSSLMVGGWAVLIYVQELLIHIWDPRIAHGDDCHELDNTTLGSFIGWCALLRGIFGSNRRTYMRVRFIGIVL